MGIVNVTPDSFSDGGRFMDMQAAIEHGRRLMEEGADILDIGGESTRPGAVAVPVEEEIARVVPVVTALAAEGAVVSIDTRNAATMAAALEAGAAIVNDVSALRHDPEALPLLAGCDAAIVLMHMQGTPETMQTAPTYADVVGEVHAFLADSIDAAGAAGIAPARILVDPGIGFGKTLRHNLTLLRHLARFGDLGAGLLLGVSRKGFIAGAVRPGPAAGRVPGSVAAALAGVARGAKVLRVHDVAETRQALAVWQAIAQA
jgi:dihydropteroate synthase